jgi:hypothetical protein
MREVCKQWLLLEEHLSDPAKRCPDCIVKHCLWAEALIDEAKQLDVTGEHSARLSELSTDQGNITAAIRGNLSAAASIVRQARKSLQPVVF